MIIFGIIFMLLGFSLWVLLFVRYGHSENTVYSEDEFKAINNGEILIGIASVISNALGVLIIAFKLLQ